MHSSANHVMYAYKIKTDKGLILSGYSDDEEIGAGKLIFETIESSNAINILICVTRIKSGGNIGLKRFELIKQCTIEAIQQDSNLQDPNSIFTQLYF